MYKNNETYKEKSQRLMNENLEKLSSIFFVQTNLKALLGYIRENQENPNIEFICNEIYFAYEKLNSETKADSTL